MTGIYCRLIVNRISEGNRENPPYRFHCFGDPGSSGLAQLGVLENGRNAERAVPPPSHSCSQACIDKESMAAALGNANQRTSWSNGPASPLPDTFALSLVPIA